MVGWWLGSEGWLEAWCGGLVWWPGAVAWCGWAWVFGIG
jgi:hypothetical protein